MLTKSLIESSQNKITFQQAAKVIGGSISVAIIVAGIVAGVYYAIVGKEVFSNNMAYGWNQFLQGWNTFSSNPTDIATASLAGLIVIGGIGGVVATIRQRNYKVQLREELMEREAQQREELQKKFNPSTTVTPERIQTPMPPGPETALLRKQRLDRTLLQRNTLIDIENLPENLAEHAVEAKKRAIIKQETIKDINVIAQFLLSELVVPKGSFVLSPKQHEIMMFLLENYPEILASEEIELSGHIIYGKDGSIIDISEELFADLLELFAELQELYTASSNSACNKIEPSSGHIADRETHSSGTAHIQLMAELQQVRAPSTASDTSENT